MPSAQPASQEKELKNKKRRLQNVRDKTNSYSKTPAEGAEPYFPESDKSHARSDGVGDEGQGEPRPQHLYGISEHLPVGQGRGDNRKHQKEREDDALRPRSASAQSAANHSGAALLHRRLTRLY